LCRRERASGGWRADGDNFGQPRGGGPADGSRFDLAVPPGGYAWWYLDAVSDDGRNALTIIGFVGSVFSPYYAFARRNKPVPAENHVALNVALYGEKRGWAMTERGASALDRDRDRLVIGPSAMRWEGCDLVISVQEWGFPLPRRLVGEIRVTPQVWGGQAFVLNEQGQHLWHPVSPLASVRLDFERPDLSWRGTGYLDHNRGDRPIAEGFEDWNWQRAAHENGALVAYSGTRRDGRNFGFCVDFGRDGVEREQVLPPGQMLPRTLWRVPRIAHGEAGTKLLKTLEDTPFYSRSIIEMAHIGRRLEAVQESLSLTRLTRPIVQAMLPFRMPRRG